MLAAAATLKARAESNGRVGVVGFCYGGGIAHMLATQLPELIAMARALPELTIICDHLATPLGTASYAGRRDADFAEWAGNIKALAGCPNVVMKVGGLAMPFGGFKYGSLGREGVRFAYEEMTQPKVVCFRSAARQT